MILILPERALRSFSLIPLDFKEILIRHGTVKRHICRYIHICMCMHVSKGYTCSLLQPSLASQTLVPSPDYYIEIYSSIVNRRGGVGLAGQTNTVQHYTVYYYASSDPIHCAHDLHKRASILVLNFPRVITWVYPSHSAT